MLSLARLELEELVQLILMIALGVKDFYDSLCQMRSLRRPAVKGHPSVRGKVPAPSEAPPALLPYLKLCFQKWEIPPYTVKFL